MLAIDRDDQFDRFADDVPIQRQSPLSLGVMFRKPSAEVLDLMNQLTVVLNVMSAVQLTALHTEVEPDRHVWGLVEGWFCAGYGPFRRLTGGDLEYARISRTLPKLARYLSIFDERVALTDCLEWLQFLKFQQLEGN